MILTLTTLMIGFERVTHRYFWGLSQVAKKGLFVFWEEDWGSITLESYCQHTSTHVFVWIHVCLRKTGNLQLFMHDNAPVHKTAMTTSFLSSLSVQPIFWSAFSPDLNLIEAVWRLMKNLLQTKYPEYERGSQRSNSDVRGSFRKTWDSVTVEQLRRLFEIMPSKCQAVIDAKGGPIGD